MSISPLAIERSRTTWLSRVLDYIELSKPRIAVMVLVAVAVAYCVGRWGQPDPRVLFQVLLGTLLVASSASACNQWLERRHDALMQRTRERPLASGRIGSRETLAFALLTFSAGSLYLLLIVGWQPACWACLSWVLYVLVYTPLKTRTSLNTAVGAVAGALPVMIGWSAGASIDLRAGALFWLLFLWQFPHFMAIAWIYRKQYANVGMQMLSVVDPTGQRAGRQAVLAALALIPVSVIPAIYSPSWGGAIYSTAVLVLGIGQLWCAFTFFRNRQDGDARRLLRASLVYLPSVLLTLTLVPWF